MLTFDPWAWPHLWPQDLDLSILNLHDLRALHINIKTLVLEIHNSMFQVIYSNKFLLNVDLCT